MTLSSRSLYAPLHCARFTIAAVSMTFAQSSSKQIITTGGNSTLPFSPRSRPTA
jgi:hypothetical protein